VKSNVKIKLIVYRARFWCRHTGALVKFVFERMFAVMGAGQPGRGISSLDLTGVPPQRLPRSQPFSSFFVLSVRLFR